jgi:hypothetical protein
VIDEAEGWFLYINSKAPAFRKARDVAVEIENFEAAFLQHNSFVDTTSHETLTEEEISGACADAERLHGFLIKAVQDRIKAMVASHEVLAPGPRAAILAD